MRCSDNSPSVPTATDRSPTIAVLGQKRETTHIWARPRAVDPILAYRGEARLPDMRPRDQEKRGQFTHNPIKSSLTHRRRSRSPITTDFIPPDPQPGASNQAGG